MSRVAKCIANEPFDSFAGYWEDEEGTRILISGTQMKGPDGTLDLSVKSSDTLTVQAGHEVWEVKRRGDGKLEWSDSSVWVKIQPLAKLKNPAEKKAILRPKQRQQEPPQQRPEPEPQRTGTAPDRPLEEADLLQSGGVPEPQGSMSDNLPSGEYQVWAVVGGGANGGIIVKMDADLTSPKLAYRLTTGARVEELEREGDRLHYHRLRGDGPDFGWVSIRCYEKVLLVKVVEETGGSRSMADWDRSSLFIQSFKRCRPIGGSQDMRRTEELDNSDELNNELSEYIPPHMSMRELTESDAYANDVRQLALEEFGFDLVRGLDLGRKEKKLEGSVLMMGATLVVGFVLYGQLDERSDMYVHYIAVHGAHRRHGFGRCLLEHVRRLCRERKVDYMSAECRFYNVEYYLGLGFTLNGAIAPNGDRLSHAGQTTQMQHLRYHTARKFRSVRRKS